MAEQPTRSSDWSNTFPVNPDVEPSVFFHHVTLLAVTNYIQGRKVLPKSCFEKRIIEGNSFYVFKRDAESGGEELSTGIKQLAEVFNTKKVYRVVFLICSAYTNNPVEALNLKYSFDSKCPPSQVYSEESLAEIKKNTFAEMNHLIAVANSLPAIPSSYYPLKFQLRYELIDSEEENPRVIENFESIRVAPNVHQLYGGGAHDLALRLQLTNGQGMEIWYYSLFLKSASEIDSAIAAHERTLDEATDTSFLNFND